MKTTAAGTGSTWDAIDAEKRRDRFMRRVNVTAWAVTFMVVLFYAIVVGIYVVRATKLAAVGVASTADVVNAIWPFAQVLGLLALLIAVLTTIGIFLRFRTASLAEIQLRLAALERMLASAPDAPKS